MLAAGFAPFTRGWLRWLWITPLPPLLYAVWVWRVGSVQGGAYGYPFFPNPDGPYWGVALSLAAGVVVLASLVGAWVFAITGSPERRSRAQVPAVCAVLVLSFGAVFIVRGSRDASAEQRIRSEVAQEARHDGQAADVERTRIQCRDWLGRPLHCAWEIDYRDGSTSGGASNFRNPRVAR
jgi:hypothetical protein